ncbi:MAG: energy transducer TonB [Magnetococcales bacterium]|nr:energy transducer TonB [Magnetococcales bacterium]
MKSWTFMASMVLHGILVGFVVSTLPPRHANPVPLEAFVTILPVTEKPPAPTQPASPEPLAIPEAPPAMANLPTEDNKVVPEEKQEAPQEPLIEKQPDPPKETVPKEPIPAIQEESPPVQPEVPTPKPRLLPPRKKPPPRKISPPTQEDEPPVEDAPTRETRNTQESTSTEFQPPPVHEPGLRNPAPPFRQTQADVLPMIRVAPKPEYPPLARRRGLEGTVLLRIFIDATGTPNRVEIMKSSGHSILDDSARETVLEWHFSPARSGGIPEATAVEVPITFRLADGG